MIGRAAAAVSLLGVLAVAMTIRGSAATELLQNGSFEAWAGNVPAGWQLLGSGSVTAIPDGSSGQGARLTTPSSVRLAQNVAVTPFALYSAGVDVRRDTDADRVALTLTFLDAGLAALTIEQVLAPVGPGWQHLALPATAPASAAYVTVAISVTGGGPAVVSLDNAALTATPAQATPTPADEPTETPTATATATSTGTVGASPPGGSPTVRVPTATRTPTPTKTVTATRTATRTATPTRTPTPRRATPAAESPAADDGSGGLLANGGFEQSDGGKPGGWSKVGGELAMDAEAHGGELAAALTSASSSTKWIHQVVPVTGGAWYRGRAFGRVAEGDAEVFLRLSWYASADGSGVALGQSESEAWAGDTWEMLDTGPVEAPQTARAVRFRLMLRPVAGDARAAFDDAVFEDAEPASPVATSTPVTATVSTSAVVAATPGGTTPTGTRIPAVATARGTSAATAVAAGPSTLRLSEILPNPGGDGRDTDLEWVEVVNIGSEAVSLAGWKLGDAAQLDVLPAGSVPPGGYVIVAAKLAVLREGVLVVRPVDGVIGRGLNNGGDAVVLIDPTGEVVDAISYGDNDDEFDPPAPLPAEGETLAVRDPRSEAGPENWARALRATPGEPNVFAVGAASTPRRAVTPGLQNIGELADARAPLDVDGSSSNVPEGAAVAAAATVAVAAVAIAWKRAAIRKLLGLS